MKTEKDYEKELNQLLKDFKHKKITKTNYLKKNIEILESALNDKNIKLSLVKKTFIKTQLKFIKQTYNMMKKFKIK